MPLSTCDQNNTYLNFEFLVRRCGSNVISKVWQTGTKQPGYLDNFYQRQGELISHARD